MIPSHLLPKISPSAAKVFLTLFSLLDFHGKVLIVRIPMTRLVELTALSPRACYRAIQQLTDLQLIRIMPRHYYTANAYFMLPPRTAPKSPSNDLPAQAGLPAKNASHLPTEAGHPTAPQPTTPVLTQKTQSLPPQAGLLNRGGKSLSPVSPGTSDCDLRA